MVSVFTEDKRQIYSEQPPWADRYNFSQQRNSIKIRKTISNKKTSQLSEVLEGRKSVTECR